MRMSTLREGLSCEYEIEERETGAIVGPELQLLRVAWVPVLVRNVLRGLVMLGSRERKKELPLAMAEKVAGNSPFCWSWKKNGGWPKRERPTWICGCG